jgi:hypothetical protein
MGKKSLLFYGFLIQQYLKISTQYVMGSVKDPQLPGHPTGKLLRSVKVMGLYYYATQILEKNYYPYGKITISLKISPGLQTGKC